MKRRGNGGGGRRRGRAHALPTHLLLHSSRRRSRGAHARLWRVPPRGVARCGRARDPARAHAHPQPALRRRPRLDSGHDDRPNDRGVGPGPGEGERGDRRVKVALAATPAHPASTPRPIPPLHRLRATRWSSCSWCRPRPRPPPRPPSGWRRQRWSTSARGCAATGCARGRRAAAPCARAGWRCGPRAASLAGDAASGRRCSRQVAVRDEGATHFVARRVATRSTCPTITATKLITPLPCRPPPRRPPPRTRRPA